MISKTKRLFLGFTLSGWLFFLCLAGPVLAEANNLFPVKFFDEDLQAANSAAIIPEQFAGMTDFAAADLGGDGQSELAVGFGYDGRPVVKIMRADGSEINSWFPYPAGYEGKVVVAAGDLDNDGKDEIVTGTGEGGGPQIRIFDGFGETKFNTGFFTEDKGYRAGIEIALADVDGDKFRDIVVSLVKNNNVLIKIFDRFGTAIGAPLVVNLGAIHEPVKIAAADLNGDNRPELILGASVGAEPRVKVLDLTGRELSSFLAYQPSFHGGFDVAAGDFSGQKVIVASAGFGGGPHVRFFNLAGEVQFNGRFFAYDESFRGGVNVALGNALSGRVLMSLPETVVYDSANADSAQLIKVDLSEQRLSAYNRGRLVKSFLISSGKRGFLTPLGDFTVYNKRPKVRMSWYYGPDSPNNYDLPNVPDVLSFKGPFTLHGAYWHHNWGHPMSHGCVNIDLVNSKWLYDWAPLGTAVKIVP
jgi:hypothetical protein